MNQKVKPQKSLGYYILTVFITLVFIGICVGIYFSIVTDFGSRTGRSLYANIYHFMEDSFFIFVPIFIIASGLCGYGYGLAILIAFYLIPIAVYGHIGDADLMMIPCYLALILVSGDVLKKQLYRTILSTLVITFLIILINIVCLGMEITEEYVFIAIPLSLASIIILYLYFRFAPDNIKKSFGMGIYYTKDYEVKINNAEPIYSDVQKEINFTETNTSSWKCSQCNNINPNHLTTCTCGKRKDENYKEAVSSKQNTYDLSGLNPKTKQCPNCRTWYGEDHQFCFSCGSKLTDTRTGGNDYVQNIPVPKAKLCPNCGTQYDEAHQFCHSCGAKLVAAAGNDTAYDNSRVSSGFNPPPNSKQCPRCRLLFNNDKEKCPVCGSELVTRD